MKLMNKVFAGLVATGVGLATTAAFAGDIRVGITMRMVSENGQAYGQMVMDCLLYTSPSPRDSMTSRMPSSA